MWCLFPRWYRVAENSDQGVLFLWELERLIRYAEQVRERPESGR